jgi:protein required for attachment to host cells
MRARKHYPVNGKRMVWVLVADGARARILGGERPGFGFAPVFAHDFAAPARAHTSQAMSDRQGRAFDSAGAGRHAMESRTDWHEHAKSVFARDMAEEVERAALKNRFDDLILVAPPRMLGELRGHLGQAARMRLACEVPKEMTHLANAALVRRLAQDITL